MQTITTKRLGATNYRGSRIVATASGNNTRVSISADMFTSDLEPHIEAAKALCRKLGWGANLIGGHTKQGMVWVFDEGTSPRFEISYDEVTA